MDFSKWLGEHAFKIEFVRWVGERSPRQAWEQVQRADWLMRLAEYASPDLAGMGSEIYTNANLASQVLAVVMATRPLCEPLLRGENLAVAKTCWDENLAWANNPCIGTYNEALAHYATLSVARSIPPTTWGLAAGSLEVARISAISMAMSSVAAPILIGGAWAAAADAAESSAWATRADVGGASHADAEHLAEGARQRAHLEMCHVIRAVIPFPDALAQLE